MRRLRFYAQRLQLLPQPPSAADQNAPTRAMFAARALGDNSRYSEISSRNENRYDRQNHRAMQALLRVKNARAKQAQPIEKKDRTRNPNP